MKSKNNDWLKNTGFILVGTLLFCILFFMADVLLDERIANWFESFFLTSEDVYFQELGYILRFPKLKWVTLKEFVFLLTIIIGFLWTTSLVIIFRISKQRAEKNMVSSTTQSLSEFFLSGDEKELLLSKGYEELAVYMANLKSQIQHNEQMLKDEIRKKNELVTYLAHDLRTPLTSVIGYLSLIDEAADMPEEQRKKYTQIALEKAYRLEKMINEFFEISRYDIQQITLSKEKIDLYYMLVQLSDELFPLLSQNGNSILLKADENIVVYGEPDKLARVFNNILKNAVSYSYPNTEIVISATDNSSSVEITFTNKGPEIAKDRLEAIFEKFYRLDDARTSNTGGTGLGLAIAREIITLHEGTITADSHNNQTIFTITLPKKQN